MKSRHDLCSEYRGLMRDLEFYDKRLRDPKNRSGSWYLLKDLATDRARKIEVTLRANKSS